MTINKVCGSGLKAVMLAAQGIATGDIEIAVAGGMESMSNAPYLLPRVREGLRMGNGSWSTRWCTTGCGAASSSATWGCRARSSPSCTRVGRAEQDEYAAASHRKAAEATRQGWFADEILPIDIPQKKGAAARRRSRRADPRGHDRRGARAR